jgi:hypothetical protein
MIGIDRKAVEPDVTRVAALLNLRLSGSQQVAIA